MLHVLFYDALVFLIHLAHVRISQCKKKALKITLRCA